MLRGAMMGDWKAVRMMPPLDEGERRVLLESWTEPPGSGKYCDFFEDGLYLCRQCGAPLFVSDAKFHCDCGWAGFDDAVPEAVTRRPDPGPLGERTEILCANCEGHLGHVFEGEGFTPRNKRHCVNSLSLSYMPTDRALFAGGCFWGVEENFRNIEGVILVVSGFTGGSTENPTYKEVCRGDTGHAETARVDFDPEVADYRSLLRVFFEIHDPAQTDRQGPDVGAQYRSSIFYLNDEQRRIAEETVAQLGSIGIKAVTKIEPAGIFYPAEDYHQKYFFKHPEGLAHSCHIRRAIDWPERKPA
jgi:peptide methionine sulfoxide reductase msrA/msrB